MNDGIQLVCLLCTYSVNHDISTLKDEDYRRLLGFMVDNGVELEGPNSWLNLTEGKEFGRSTNEKIVVVFQLHAPRAGGARPQ